MPYNTCFWDRTRFDWIIRSCGSLFNAASVFAAHNSWTENLRSNKRCVWRVGTTCNDANGRAGIYKTGCANNRRTLYAFFCSYRACRAIWVRWRLRESRPSLLPVQKLNTGDCIYPSASSRLNPRNMTAVSGIEYGVHEISFTCISLTLWGDFAHSLCHILDYPSKTVYKTLPKSQKPGDLKMIFCWKSEIADKWSVPDIDSCTNIGNALEDCTQ